VQTGLSDTDPDVLRLQAELLRQTTPERRLEMALSLSAALQDAHYVDAARWTSSTFGSGPYRSV
jgi:hypothetical protein